MDNATFGDLMSEYEKHKDAAARFHSWSRLDEFVQGLIKQIAPKKSEDMPKWNAYHFDDMGTALPHEEHYVPTFDPIDGKRIE